jgi:peroxiredoxin
VRIRLALAALALLSLGADDGPVRVESLAGEPVELALAPGEAALVVHFWASWCRDCGDELAGFAQALGGCAERRVRVACVNVGESREEAERFLARHAPGVTTLRDPKGRAWRKLSGAGLPLHLILTPAGRRVELGAKRAEEWRRIFAELGCAPPPTPGGSSPGS